MKKLKVSTLKFCLVILALMMPVAVTGILATYFENFAQAESGNHIYEHSDSVSVTNGNFNSSTVTSISESPSGWSKILDDGKVTSGVINVGSNFNTYRKSTYHLSVNPSDASSDTQILMINSKTETDQRKEGREGYQSSAISLEANSYYSFAVSVKSDSNYEEDYEYIKRGETDKSYNVRYNSSFDEVTFGDDAYVQLSSIGGKYYYAQKYLTSAGNLESAYTTNKAFYVDSEYVGFNHKVTTEGDVGEEPVTTTTSVYAKIADVQKISILSGTTIYDEADTGANKASTEKDYTLERADMEFLEGDFIKVTLDGATKYVQKKSVNYVFDAGVEYFSSSIKFTPNASNENEGTFSVDAGTTYYAQNTVYNNLNEYGVASIYLKGLKDNDGKDVELKYERFVALGWQTFRFFIATGDEAQEINFELWLGGENAGCTGVVFYDNLNGTQYSENLFYKTYKAEKDATYEYSVNGKTTEISTTKFVSFKEDNSIETGANLNFEDGSGLGGWKKRGGGHAQILPLNSQSAFENTTGYDFVGSNLSSTVVIDGDNIEIKDNNNAMALWAKNNYVEVKSKDINVDSHKIYKITAYYKISELDGTAYLKIEENENIFSEYPALENTYTLASGSASATSNSENLYVNSYGTMEIYVKGSNIYNSSINIVLGVGSSDTSATGCVVFDDIKVEEISASELATAEEDSATIVKINENTAEQSIANGNFNNTTGESKDFPLTPSDWTFESGNGKTFAGVINTKASEYQKYQQKYRENIELGAENPYLWASATNPLDPDETSKYNNNILMLNNNSLTHQTVKSANFALDPNSHYRLSFDYKTANSSANAFFNILIYNEDGVLLYEEKGVQASRWNSYEILFKTFFGTENCYVQIEFGTEDEKVSGYAYFDNFALSTIEETEFDEGKNKVDMTNFYANLPTNNISSDLKDFSSSAYKTSGYDDQKQGGIVNATYFDNTKFAIDDENKDEKSAFVLTTKSSTTYVIDSVYKFDLTSGNYYTLTFKLKTSFLHESYEDVDVSENDFGAIVGLSGFDYMTNLISNDEYTEYTLHIRATEDATATLHLALQSDDYYTTGTMVVYDLNFTEISSDDENASEGYDNAKEVMDEKGYDVNSDHVYAVTNSTDDDTDSDTSEGDETETPENDDFTWLLLIASLITGLAIVIAVVGYFLRKVKIKKIETKRKETYDRKGTLHRDSIRKEAEDERDAEVKAIEANIKRFEDELSALESEHKEKVVALRKDDGKELSKATEKEFKLFAQKRAVLSEKIDVLKHQLENAKSPEYLLSLERKKAIEAETKQRALTKKTEPKKEQNETSKKTDDKKSNKTDIKTDNKKKNN